MTIVCNDIFKLREIYFNKFVNVTYIIDITDEEEIYEIAKDKLKIMQISATVILSVDEFCSIEDMLGELKAHDLDAIVFENLTTTYNQKYIGFKTLDELIDFVINENKKCTFMRNTADELSDEHEKSNNKAMIIQKLYEVSCDNMILPKKVREMFIF